MKTITEITNLLQQLVAIKSTADKPDELARVIELAEHYFDIPELTTTLFKSNDKVNLLVQPVATSGHEFDIVLNAHLDVVPAKDEQFSMALHGGQAYGRGVYDMKGGAAAIMKLYKDLAQSNELGNVALTLVTDEEIGGHNGAKTLLEKEGITGKFFLVAEPTDFSICHQQKGILWLELTEHGKPAHGSRPWEGQNANISLAQKITAFYASQPQPTGKDDWKTSYTLSIIRGGGEAKNVVADTAIAYMDIRRVTSESPSEVLAKVQRGFEGTAIKVLLDEPCLDTDPASLYIQHLSSAIEQKTHKKAVLTRETFGSDARFYSAVGVPAVNFGPIGGDMHGDNEWVDLESLQTYYDIMKIFLQENSKS